MNFGCMVEHIRSAWVFWGLGVGSMLATLAVLLAFFRRKSWL